MGEEGLEVSYNLRSRSSLSVYCCVPYKGEDGGTNRVALLERICPCPNSLRDVDEGEFTHLRSGVEYPFRRVVINRTLSLSKSIA